MARIVDAGQREPAVGLVGNYLPRRCGIATFTSDLAETLARLYSDESKVFVVAMNDRPGGYEYPERVLMAVDYDDPAAYVRAAGFLNSRSTVVCLQHEFGIFGGQWGSHVLELARNIQRPLVVTCHTVARTPPPAQKAVFKELLSCADKVVTMNRAAVGILADFYNVAEDRIDFIPHGLHDIPFKSPGRKKRMIGVEGRVLLTFGLLHREKGIDYMIGAMPYILEHHPDTYYVVAGNTHPAIKQKEGESYRRSLQRRAFELGIRDNIVFIDRFSTLSDLMILLSESDVFVAPYLNLDQTTSGALTYAIGAGNAVVATPFLDAKALLAGGRGRFVPPGKSLPLVREILDLLGNPLKIEAMRRSAYAFSRHMVWPEVARAYLKIFVGLRAHRPAIRVPDLRVVQQDTVRPSFATVDTISRTGRGQDSAPANEQKP